MMILLPPVPAPKIKGIDSELLKVSFFFMLYFVVEGNQSGPQLCKHLNGSLGWLLRQCFFITAFKRLIHYLYPLRTYLHHKDPVLVKLKILAIRSQHFFVHCCSIKWLHKVLHNTVFCFQHCYFDEKQTCVSIWPFWLKHSTHSPSPCGRAWQPLKIKSYILFCSHAEGETWGVGFYPE